MDIQKIRTLLGLSADRPLSPEEKRRRIRYIVYPAMCLLFAGSLWLIYSPSEKEREAEEKEKGFNTDIPSPGQQRMDGNKVDAYEREELEKKDKYRKNAFQEMASLFGSSGKDTVHLPEGMAELPVEGADNPSTGSHNTVRSSASAYRNMNRTLDNFYTRAENSERNELLRRIEELEHERQMKKPENSYEITAAVIPANSLKGTIKIRLFNTDEIQNGASYKLYIQLKESSTLGLGPKEYITATLSWNSNIIAPPATERYLWMTYNSLIKSSLAPTSSSTTAYSSNALKTIVTALDWDDWDDMTAHPDQPQRPTYFTYKYLANYRLFVTDKSYEAYAAKLADYLKKYQKEHPDAPLVHNEGNLKGQIIEARTY